MEAMRKTKLEKAHETLKNLGTYPQTFGVGTAWISGVLNDLAEARGVVERAEEKKGRTPARRSGRRAPR